MNPEDYEIIVDRIRFALESGQMQSAVGILLDIHPVDQAEVFNRLEDGERDILLPQLEIADAADLLEELEDEDVLEAVETLTTEYLADVLDEMEPDEAADLLGDLPSIQVSEVLAQMEDAEEVIPLLGYPDETAGGLMTTSYIALRVDTTVEQAIEFLRQVSPDTEVPYYLYVVDIEGCLIGVVGLRELVISRPDTTADLIMDTEVLYVDANIDQEEAARVMTRYDLTALPVVDEQQHLVGVISHDDILDVLEDEATEDIYRLGTVSDTDLEPESPVGDHLKGRLPWLLLNMMTALFASWVILQFEDVIAQVAVLAAFQSVVAGLGGNSGGQSVVMLVRAIALGKTHLGRAWRMTIRQAFIGILLGIAVGAVVGLGVYLLLGNLALGLILFLALVGNMFVAGIAGTLVPFILTKLGKDPALASSVLVTAVTDSCGFFIFLSLAAAFLPYLQVNP